MAGTRLTHLDEAGRARMVDVGGKPASARTAVASGRITMSAQAFALLTEGGAPKGDVLAAARIAGIMAAKRTSELIPLCHQLPVSKVAVDFEPDPDGPALRVRAEVRTMGQTGVEMEALTAVSIACLTVYDMLKAVDRTMEIGSVRLESKSGGASGEYRRS